MSEPNNFTENSLWFAQDIVLKWVSFKKNEIMSIQFNWLIGMNLFAKLLSNFKHCGLPYVI